MPRAEPRVDFLVRRTVSDTDRITNLEGVVRALVREVAELRAEVRGTAAARGASGRPLEGADEAASATGDERGGAPPTSESTARVAPVPHRTPAAPSNSSPSDSSRPAAGPAPSPARPRPRPTTRDLEGLVGRYGTMALAALTIVMGVGAFLRWAVEHVEIGPPMRVALGAALAALIAAFGWRLRVQRGGGSRRYGNTLLGLALAVVHVDAWGAGPALHVVPSGVALAVAAVASAALAGLAFASGEQALFAVGLGGALLAPFVTSTGGGTVPALLAYGLVVVAGAAVALGSAAARGRRWDLARRLTGAGGAAYAVAALPLSAPPASWPMQAAPPAFAVLCAALALAVAGRDHRVPLARALLVGAFVALVARAVDRAAGGAPVYPVVIALVATAFLGSAVAHAAALVADEDDSRAVVWGALLPVALLLAALVALPDNRGLRAALVAAAWALLGAAAAVRAGPSRRRPPAIIAAAAAAAAAIILGCNRYPVAGAAGLAALGTLVALLAAYLAGRREPARLVLLPAALALLAASSWALDLLELRSAYAYTPFLTRASLAALAAVIGWSVSGVVVARAAWERDAAAAARAPLPESWRAAVASLGVVAAFLWGRQELARAGSRDLSTFLLIGYYALAGVLAIFVGRRRTVAGARRVGLALAVYGALKALAEASGLAQIALRVGSFLVVGLFLLGVAYWYRATGEEESAA